MFPKNITTQKINLSKLFLSVESFFATWAIMRIANLHSMNIIAFLFFLLSMVFFSTLEKEITTQKQENIKSPSPQRQTE